MCDISIFSNIDIYVAKSVDNENKIQWRPFIARFIIANIL